MIPDLQDRITQEKVKSQCIFKQLILFSSWMKLLFFNRSLCFGSKSPKTTQKVRDMSERLQRCCSAIFHLINPSGDH